MGHSIEWTIRVRPKAISSWALAYAESPRADVLFLPVRLYAPHQELSASFHLVSALSHTWYRVSHIQLICFCSQTLRPDQTYIMSIKCESSHSPPRQRDSQPSLCAIIENVLHIGLATASLNLGPDCHPLRHSSSLFAIRDLEIRRDMATVSTTLFGLSQMLSGSVRNSLTAKWREFLVTRM